MKAVLSKVVGGPETLVVEDIPAPETVREDISLEARLFDGLIRGLSLRESSDELIAQGERKNAVKAAALRVKERLGE